MRGLQADERGLLEYIARVAGSCSGVPNTGTGRAQTSEERLVSQRLHQQGRIYPLRCTCGRLHVRVSPAGHQALSLDSIARGTVSV
jgi:hypothetical protein